MRNKDFEISRLEDLNGARIEEVTPFRHRLYSLCLAQELDMELNIGYYKRISQAPYLLFKSPFQVMSCTKSESMKKCVTGSTALGLIHGQIITLAKTLLLHTDLTVKEIAFCLSDPYNFKALFARMD